jgi:pSer/pThr/pTyr-binding forkhead associated (FHA) protein
LQCTSCSQEGGTGTFCERCGAALPVKASADTAFSLMLGLVCERCDTYNEPGSKKCVLCGEGLVDDARTLSGAIPVMSLPSAPAIAAPATSSERSKTPAPPSWLSAPTGRPIATAAALPRVDLATVMKAAAGGLQAPREQPELDDEAQSAPTIIDTRENLLASAATTQPNQAPAVSHSDASGEDLPIEVADEERGCARCGVPVALDDKFCRNCGARLDLRGPSMQTNLPELTPPPSSVAPMTVQDSDPLITAPHPAIGVGPSPSEVFGAAAVTRTARLILVRGHSTFGSQWRMQTGALTIGRSKGLVLFPDDPHLAPEHCRLAFRGDELWLTPLPTTNGVFVRVREPARIQPGDEIVVGATRLRILGTQDRAIDPRFGKEDAVFFGSPLREKTPISLQRVSDDPRCDETYVRTQRVLSLGRSSCDINFPYDGFVSERHALIKQASEHLILEDSGSRNGTYVRAKHERRLWHGDVLLLGEQVLRVEVSTTK